MENKMAEWLIMVYIVGDNTLANFGIESLKQLKAAASEDVVVVAQVDIDGSAGRQETKWYLFDGTTITGACQDPYTSIENNRVKDEMPSVEMASPESLTAFVNWAYNKRPADRHCLVLWGHGPELLFERARDGKTRLYLTPVELEKALTDAGLGSVKADQSSGTRKLDILGIDACCMSLIEVACQLPIGVDLLVASQDEVPDASFPYDRLLDIFKYKGKESELICREIVERYAAAYQDYVCDHFTDTRQPTLSALQRKGIGDIEAKLACLARELLRQDLDDGIRTAILSAREHTQGYLAGLFADISDFCSQLQKALESQKGEVAESLRKHCQAVCDAFNREEPSCVVANHSKSGRDCGLSIYFPYRVGEETYGLPKIKNGNNKASSDQLNKASSDQLNKARLQTIQETEKYYQDLRFARDSGWGTFIQQVWSRILAKARADELDIRYSGEQCAHNLLACCTEFKNTGQKEVGEPDLVPA